MQFAKELVKHSLSHFENIQDLSVYELNTMYNIVIGIYNIYNINFVLFFNECIRK